MLRGRYKLYLPYLRGSRTLLFLSLLAAILFAAANALGARYIRATGQSQWILLKERNGVAALEDADGSAFRQALESMEADLRDNGARVIGEIHVNSANSAANPRVDRKSTRLNSSHSSVSRMPSSA